MTQQVHDTLYAIVLVFGVWIVLPIVGSWVYHFFVGFFTGVEEKR
jgi:hypothetical protein